MIDADGSNPTRLFAGGCCIEDWQPPVWSPDGTEIAFSDDVDVKVDRWLVVHADGSGAPRTADTSEVQAWERP